MPIYAYRCEECGFAKDVLQKMSDDVLTVCTECGKSSLKKQVTAAGFQLKGSGWYVTDFRGGAGVKSDTSVGNGGESASAVSAPAATETASATTATAASATSAANAATTVTPNKAA